MDWDFMKFKLDNFLGVGRMFIEQGLDTTRFAWFFGVKKEEDSCGDIERDICFVDIFLN